VWIYQSDKTLSPDYEKIIENTLRSFTEQWTVHGAPMDTSFKIEKSHFLILAANDQASGCSIDSSVRVIRELGDKLGVDFFNRNQIAFWIDNQVKLIPLPHLKTAYAEKVWDAKTPYFNNLINTVDELNKGWLVPAEKTWLSRYLLQETLSD
jgi:hypothetical protein